MTRPAQPVDEHPAVEAVAGLLAAASVVVGLVGLAYHPARLTPAAIVVALVAAAMTTRWRRLAGAAVAVTSLCWVVGMTIAVLTSGTLY